VCLRRGGGGNLFCGGPVPQTGEPTDLAHVVGDQTLEYMADQPASLMVCSKGYLFEKCGDHDGDEDLRPLHRRLHRRNDLEGADAAGRRRNPPIWPARPS
jgi:hypothetical protein